MIEALYIIGVTFTLLMLAHKLRDLRQQLRRVTLERDSYAQLIQVPFPDDRALPAVVRGRSLEGPQE